MARKTQAVYDLVREVLEALPHPYGEDITEDVFVAIERNPQWYLRYRAIDSELTPGVLNQSIGKYTKDITNKQVLQEGVTATRTGLTKTYTRLK